MFDTIKRSFQLFKVCLHVLSVDKELVFFPIFSAAGVVAVMLAFLGVGFGAGLFDNFGVGVLVIAFLFYFLAYFVIIFFNSALVFAAHERLAGGDPNISSGLRGASNRIAAIFMWAVIAATVGLILQILSSQAREAGGVMGIISQIIIALLGAAWTLITYFVVPLIVIERRPLFDSFKTSVAIVRRTWGEQVTASVGFGILQIIAYVIAVIIAGALGLLLSPLGSAGWIIAIVLGVALIALITLIFATLDGIYKAALYNYAVNGEIPSLFPADMMRYAFREQ